MKYEKPYAESFGSCIFGWKLSYIAQTPQAYKLDPRKYTLRS